MSEEFKTIELQDNESLEGETYPHPSFKTLIRVVGDNVTLDNLLIYGPKNEFNFIIEILGSFCLVRNCRFHEINYNGVIIKTGPDTVVQDTLFISRKRNEKGSGNEAILIGGDNNILINNRFDEYKPLCINAMRGTFGGLIINNDFIYCQECVYLKDGNNTVAYNSFDDKNNRKMIAISNNGDNTVLGNVFLNLKLAVDNGDYPLFLKSNVFYNCASPINHINKTLEPVYNVIIRCSDEHGTIMYMLIDNIVDLEDNKRIQFSSSVFKFTIPYFNKNRYQIDYNMLKEMIILHEGDNFKLFKPDPNPDLGIAGNNNNYKYLFYILVIFIVSYGFRENLIKFLYI